MEIFLCGKKLYSCKRSKDGKDLCKNCLTTFSTEDVMKKHQKKCLKNRPPLLKFPEKDSFAFKEFCERKRFFVDMVDIEGMNEILSNTDFGSKDNKYI